MHENIHHDFNLKKGLLVNDGRSFFIRKTLHIRGPPTLFICHAVKGEYMKNDYSRSSFWVVKENEKTRYYIYKKGKRIEVEKPVFLCCLYSYRKVRKLQQQDHDHVDLYENMDIFSKGEEDPLQDLIKQQLQELITEALCCLTEQERALIVDIFYKEKTQQQISEELQIPAYSVSRMKTRILKKLKKIIENLQDAESIKSLYK